MKTRLISLLMFCASLSYSQGSSTGESSLRLPLTPSVAGTGEAFVADTTSLQSMRLNPANGAARTTYGVLFSHTAWIQDTRMDLLTVAAPFSFGALSFSAANTAVDNIEVRQIPGPPIGTFSSESAFFQLTYAAEITSQFRIGIAPKYLYEKIYVDEATGFGVDAGAVYLSSIEGLTIGCSIADVGTQAAFRTQSSSLPSTLHLGGTYSLPYEHGSIRIALADGMEWKSSVHHLSAGVEASFRDVALVRFGYESGYDARGFSAGLGIRYGVALIDYAYIPFRYELGNSHIISIELDLQ